MNKKLTAKIQKLVPALGEKEAVFSSSIAIEPPEKELVLKKGSVYTVFDVRSSIPLSLGLLTNVINDVLYDSYYHSDNVSPIQSLEKAIVNINDKIALLGKDAAASEAAEGTQPQEVQLEFNIIAGVLWGNVLYIVQYGNGKSFLMRQGEIKEVSSTSEGKFSVASGVVNDDDVIVLSTSNFAGKFPPEKLLSTAISSNDLEPDQSSMVLKFLVDSEFTENEKIDFNLPKEKKSSKISKVIQNIKGKKLKKEPKVKPIETLADMSNIADAPKPENSSGGMPPIQSQDVQQDAGPAKIDMPPITTNNSAPLPPITKNTDTASQVKIKSELKPRAKPNLKIALLTVAVLLVGSIFVTVILKNRNNDAANNGKGADNSSLTLPREPKETAAAEEKEEKPADNTEQLKQEDIKNKVARVEAQPFYDLKLADENANPSGLVVFANTIAVTDSNSGKIFTSSTSTPKFAAIKDAFTGIKNALNYDGKLNFIDSEGFKIYDLASEAVTQSFTGTFGVSGVYLGNIYSAENGTITKYVKSGDSLEKSTWAESAEFNNVVDLDVAYSIYTITKDAKVNVYTSGEKGIFNISGLTPALSKPVDLEVNNDYDYIYIADAGNKRVVLLDSDGALVRQIKLDEEDMWNDIKAIGVNSDETVLYVLSGTKVYDVDLVEALKPLEEETTEETTTEDEAATSEETADTTETTEETGESVQGATDVNETALDEEPTDETTTTDGTEDTTSTE